MSAKFYGYRFCYAAKMAGEKLANMMGRDGVTQEEAFADYCNNFGKHYRLPKDVDWFPLELCPLEIVHSSRYYKEFKPIFDIRTGEVDAVILRREWGSDII